MPAEEQHRISLQLPEVEPPRQWTGRLIIDNGIAGMLARKADKLNLTLDEQINMEQLTRDDMKQFMLDAIMTIKEDKNLAGNWTLNIIGQSKGDVTEILIERLHTTHESAARWRCSCCSNQAAVFADRSLLPMSQAVGIINQGANGTPGTPLCRTCLVISITAASNLALFSNKWLLVDGDPEFMVALQRELHQVAKAIQETRRKGKDSIEKTKFAYKALAGAISNAAHTFKEGQFTDSEIMFLTPFGGEPRATMVPVSGRLIEFLKNAQSAKYRAGWSLITANEENAQETDRAISSLFSGQDDPRAAIRLISRLVYGRGFAKGTPQAIQDAWNVAELYLKEVSMLTQERIEAIKKLGDNIFDIIQEDERDYRKFFGPKINDVRNAIVRENERRVANKLPPIIESADLWVTFSQPDEELRPMGFYEAMQLMSVHVHARLHELNLSKATQKEAQQTIKSALKQA